MDITNVFAGLSGDQEAIEPQHLLLDQTLQIEVTELFEQQAASFVKDDMERVEFDPRANYNIENDQIFVIRKFPLPAVFADAIAKPHQTVDFSLRNPIPKIVTIFAGTVAGKVIRRVLFQQFRSPQFLDKRFAILPHGGTFHRIKHNGISLAHELAAIHENDTLMFRSLNIVSRFFDLAQYQPKATPAEINDFICDGLFAVEDMPKIYRIIENDDWLVRRVASIQSNGVLGHIKATTASTKAKVFGISVTLKNVEGERRISLPDNKKDLKRLVKFLNEEYFHGELSQELYETNSLHKLRSKA